MKYNYISNRKINSVSAPANIVLIVFFTIVSLVCIIPILIVLSSSFMTDTAIFLKGYSIIPDHPTLLAYMMVLQDQGRVVRGYGIQILSTVLGTALSVLVTSMLCYPLSRRELPYRNFFAFFVFFTILFSGGLAPTYFLYTNFLHLKNTLFVLFIPFLVNGYYVLILRTFFSTNISSEIIESARIDGSGEFRTFFRIVFPLSLPGIATIALFTTIGLWNDWYLSMLYIDKEYLTNLQYMMVKTLFDAEYIRANPGLMATYGDQMLKNLPVQSSRMAMAIIGIGPIVIAYPFFQRFFIKGLTIGAVKG
jgi:putative aldouronate transport system permease protein